MAAKDVGAKSKEQFLHYLAFMTDFTYFCKKLAFLALYVFMKLMSKVWACMYRLINSYIFRRLEISQTIEFTNKILIYSAIVLCFSIIVACKQHANDDHRQSGSNGTGRSRTLTRGLPGEPQTLDPQLADDTYSFQVVRDMYEGLTAEDRHGQIVGGVAKSWSVDSTGEIYTFQLRPDARWSDGHPVVAGEFVRGLRRAVDPKTASEAAALLSVIKCAVDITAGRKSVMDLGVTAVGETTVQVVLEHPAPFILQLLAEPIAAPFHLSSVASPRSDAVPVVTNGPYTLGTRVPNSFIELVRNPAYWDAKNVAIDTIRYSIAESESTELREYLAGQLEMTFNIPMSDFPRMARAYPSEVQTAPILGTFYLALDLSEPPMRDSPELRQALSMAVDREAIALQVMMGVTPAYSFVSEGTTGYESPEYEWSKWDRERRIATARRLFKQAGYSDKGTLKLKVYFNRDEGIKRIMVAIAAGWKQTFGIESELISDEFRVFLAGRKDRSRWDVARLAWSADYDDPASFLEVFAHSNTENDPAYESAPFNTLIERARTESNPVARLAILQQSERVLLGDYPIIPIYFYKSRRLVKPYVGGAEITPMNHSYSKHLFWKQ